MTEYSLILAKLHLLEITKGKYTRKEFEAKFDAFTEELKTAEIIEATREAKNVLPDDFCSRAFIRRLKNVILIRFGHKPQKTDKIPVKTFNLLYELELT